MLIHFVLGLYSVSAPSTEPNCKCVLHRPRFGLFLELQLFLYCQGVGHCRWTLQCRCVCHLRAPVSILLSQQNRNHSLALVDHVHFLSHGHHSYASTGRTATRAQRQLTEMFRQNLVTSWIVSLLSARTAAPAETQSPGHSHT